MPPSIFLAVAYAEGANTASEIGPTSDAEAALLRTEGQKALSKKRYERAASRLQRLVDRYPGYPGYLEAHLQLGQALLGLGRGAKAITPLKYYVQGTRNPAELNEGRLWLARAYLQDEKFNEAYLTCNEVEASPPTTALVALQNALIKSRALQGLGRINESKEALETARKSAAGNPTATAALAGETLAVGLEVKLSECAQLPSAGPLAEDQIKNQLERRGTCLLESLPPYRNLLGINEAPLSNTATEVLENAFADYLKACGSPPPPPEIRPTPRNAEQLRQYHRELREALQADCREKLTAASRLLAGWNGDFVRRLRVSLEKLKSPSDSPGPVAPKAP